MQVNNGTNVLAKDILTAIVNEPKLRNIVPAGLNIGENLPGHLE